MAIGDRIADYAFNNHAPEKGRLVAMSPVRSTAARSSIARKGKLLILGASYRLLLYDCPPSRLALSDDYSLALFGCTLFPRATRWSAA